MIEEMVWLGDIPVATLRPSGSTVAIYYVHAGAVVFAEQMTGFVVLDKISLCGR